MRELFFHYNTLTEDQLNRIWKECIFTFHSSALLSLYGLSAEKRAIFINILKELDKRTWLPYQTAAHFYQSRPHVIASQIKVLQDVQLLSESGISKLKEDLGQLISASDDSLQLDGILDHLDKSLSDITASLQHRRSQGEKLLSSAEILDKVNDLFAGKVGPNYSQRELNDKYKEIADRYERQIPPGHLALESKPPPHEMDENPEAYGDAILWFQLIDYIRQQGRPLILVTNQISSDWWLSVHDRIIAPRPELIREVYQKAGVSFHMYQTEAFVHEAQQRLGIKTLKGAKIEFVKQDNGKSGRRKY